MADAFIVTQTMVKDATTLTLPYPDSPGYNCVTRRAQRVLQTFGGEPRVADQDVSWYETEFEVTINRDVASNQDMVALEAFWDNTVKGALESFTWTDIQGTAHSDAKFLGEELDAEPVTGNLVRVTLRIRTDERVYN